MCINFISLCGMIIPMYYILRGLKINKYIYIYIYTLIHTQLKSLLHRGRICYDYTDENVAVKVDCEEQLQSRNLMFVVVIGILAAGGIFLVKGIRGTWDNDVKPEEMLGPGGDKKDDS